MSLKEYRRKRKFAQTPEPAPKKKRTTGKGLLHFVVQKHAATRTHYDFRLEIDGALKSWAVPKGPSLTAQDPRLAVHVEDHPIEYGSFEGVIPKGNYGAGTVMIWDFGTYLERGSQGRADSEKALREGLAKGHLTFLLNGTKLRGEFALVKIKNRRGQENANAWLLIKKLDSEASRMDVTKENRSTASGRSMEEIAAQAEAKGEIWLPKKGRVTKKVTKAAVPKPRVKAIPTTMPRRVRPMDPVFSASVPDEKNYLFETLGAGVRAIAEVEPARVQLYSRTFLPFEKKYPTLTAALKKLGHQAVLDGEIVKKGGLEYLVSDLLFLDGKDLRLLPLQERKKILSHLSLPKPLKAELGAAHFSELKGNPSQVVAKNIHSVYRSGLNRDWLRFRIQSSGTKKIPLSELPPLTHLDKIYWPKERYTKGDLLHYYESISDVILPYLVDRPQSLHRQPDGIRNEGFFHKDMSSFLPRRIQTERVFSASSGHTINYALCQDRWSLLYLVNLGCIELNPWLSRRTSLDRPDFVVIDLDPDGNDFKEVVKVARDVYAVLQKIGAKSYCKTSGSSGLHICIPTGGRFSYDTTRMFAEMVARVVHQRLPALTSVERNPAKRRRRIYLDFLQNRRGQTLAAPYCVRPHSKAPVSTPLKWTEVKSGLTPDAFTIKTIARRLARVGDLWKPLLNSSVNIEACMKQLSKYFHI
jgi:DNA ligase D-like protein (predicted polymerase)/DNA ligase D-like protein (predicted 3'-phosphoesterase)